jgi:hypothetical protein
MERTKLLKHIGRKLREKSEWQMLLKIAQG